jgi:hypothetical protein
MDHFLHIPIVFLLIPADACFCVSYTFEGWDASLFEQNVALKNIMPLSLKTLGILKEQCKERSIQINTAHQKRIIWMWRWKDDRASLLDSSHRVIGRIESVTSTGVNCYVQIGIQIARMDRFQDMYLIKLVWFWFELRNDVRTAKKKWTLYVLLDHLHKWHGYQGIRSS